MATESQRTPAGLEARPPQNGQARLERSPAQIEADIEATRVRLAGTVDAIAERVKPANVAHRVLESLKAQVLEPDGTVRTQRVALVATCVLAVAGLAAWRRSR